MKLALVVSADTLRGTEDTPVLLDAARAAGDEVRLFDWRARHEWHCADAVLLHSPWDYTQHLPDFGAWLQATSERHAVFNPWSRIAGNTHKGYLLALGAAGVPIPRTAVLRAREEIDLPALSAGFGAAPVVVKPAVGSGGRRLIRLGSPSEIVSSPLVDPDGVPPEDLVVQEFVPSVPEQGEYALVMVGGRPAHLIHKVPASGEFRVQARFGGRTVRVPLDAAASAMAESMRPHLTGLAYARVDYVFDSDGRPLLIELEATEPDLFLQHAPESAVALLDHVRANLRASR